MHLIIESKLPHDPGMLFASEAQLVLIPYNFPLLHFIPETLKSVKRWLPLVFYLKPFYHIARILLRASRLGVEEGCYYFLVKREPRMSKKFCVMCVCVCVCVCVGGGGGGMAPPPPQYT